MKTIKRITVATLMLLIMFAFVGCTESNVLDSLIKATGDMETVAVEYSADTLTANDGLVVETAYSVNEYQVVLLADTENLLITFNELRLELIALHEEIVGVREEIRTYAESIRASVETLKEMEYVLLEDDKAFILEQIDILKAMREDILATRGEAYQRIYDLRGTYSRENLADIIIVYQEVKEVLEFRLLTLQSSIEIFAGIDNLLKEYLEN